MSSPAPEEDSLSNLEERIRHTVELVTSLRAERDQALAQRDAVLAGRDEERGAAKAENQKLRQEIEDLRGERKHVRTRIEKLLGQMDLLSGA